jgi:AraC-like DNA-binding protein
LPDHQKILIPDTLRQFVKHVWYIDGNIQSKLHADPHAETIGTFSQNNTHTLSLPNFADGNPGLIFQQFASGKFDCEQQKDIPRNYVFGQTVLPISLSVPQNCTIIGVIFYPHVLQSIFRFSAKEITDNVVDLHLLPAVPRINLSEQLWDMSTPAAQVQIIFRYLELLVNRNNAVPDKGMQYASGKIMRLNGQVSMKQLQSELNLSERTFERKFEQHVGVSSRLLSGIAQFQASLKQLRNGSFLKLSDIAYDNGYADQSHFIRIFKRFTGMSPLQFYKQLNGITEPGSFILQ